MNTVTVFIGNPIILLCTVRYVPYVLVVFAATAAGNGTSKEEINFTQQGSEFMYYTKRETCTQLLSPQV